jgi:hypothetical protein
MMTIYNKYVYLLLLLLVSTFGSAQVDTDCDPLAKLPVSQGDIIVNYGSVTNAFSFRNRSSFTVAQPLVGSGVGKDFTSQTGFWTRFLLPPKAPQTVATQGEFPDRVLITWNLDPLSAEPFDGYVVTRDGAFLTQVDKKVNQFIDFNVQAGEIYDYGVYGRNKFGNGSEGKSYGFVNPNGAVSGLVRTFSNNPVPGSIVKLTPIVGTAMMFDGNDDYLCVTHTPVVPNEMWTVSSWVKIGATHDKDGIIDLGSDINKNFWIHTTPSTMTKGVVIGTGDGTQKHELIHLFGDEPDGWHQITAVYAAGSLLLYVDGQYISSIKAPIAQEDALITIGARRNLSGFFDGRIDDVRLYNRPLTSTEILLTKDLAVSKKTAGLVAYWKFDEGIGRRTFDIGLNGMHAYLFGATFTDDHSRVQNGGMTDETGFYSIEGINYSKVENFSAIPSKIFYKSYALETNAAYEAYAELTDFDLVDSATVEIIVHPYDITSRQTILSKGSDFELWIQSGNLNLTINGENTVLGPIATAYQHLSFTIDAGTDEVNFYKNGTFVASHSFASAGGDWIGDKWQLAAKGSTPEHYYTGLIDEVVFYKNLLSIQDIQLNASQFGEGGTNIGHPDLVHFFDLNEGKGTLIEDTGVANVGDGIVHNATFSIITYNQEAVEHVFRPSQRLVNINPSNTAASGIDFTDESTVTISGVVRFENTFCYQDSVEILVNGESGFPKIYTDSEGKFVADFEPGASVILTPKYEDHIFAPGFFRVRNINRPIANILFANQTKREVSGQLAGGHCKFSVIPEGSIAKVKARSQNGCYEQVITFDTQEGPSNGKFNFKNLPPIPLTFSVTEHSVSPIASFFSNLAGEVLDMRTVEKDTIDFIYIAPPTVYIQPFEENGCEGSGQRMIDQSVPTNGYKLYQRDVKVFEDYFGEKCYLDSFNLIINNDIGDQAQYSAVSDSSTYVVNLWAGIPNINAPYTKFLQVTAEVNGAQATAVEQVIVLGERSRESTFTTASPVMPQIILRDPPGDASSATLAKGVTTCTTWSNASLTSITDNASLEVDLGSKVTTYAGSPVGGVITEAEQVATVTVSGTFGASATSESAGEVCLTTEESFSTSSGDAIVGPLADLYVGAAVNFEFSATDILKFDPDMCSFDLSTGVKVAPSGFGTRYIYSEWQILTDVIPSLELLGDTASVKAWKDILAYNSSLKASAKFVENITFDALNVYSKTVSSSTTNSYNFTTDITWTAAMSATLGFEIFGAGSKVTLGFEVGGSESASNGGSTNNTTSVNFTLADDDPNDNYTIDILDDAVFGTPVFKLKAGETMCPWEPGTLNREEVGFSIDRLTAINIPENDPATFKLSLSNNGQTGNDPLVYKIGKVSGTNPNGANYAVNGSDFDELIIQLQPGETQILNLDITRVNNNYSFEGLGIYMASDCQWNHALGLGYDLSGAYSNPTSPTQGPYKTEELNKFYKEFSLNVQFVEPCTPVGISAPMQDWVMTPAGGDNMFITLNEYIYDDPDLKEIRVQYRVTGGDGSWINIVTLPKSEFANNPLFKIVTWDMAELADGPYEIRAISFCNDVSLAPGTSAVIKGRKETKPPKVFGIPQPADGLLNPGDEISISFSKRINCNKIFPADGIGTNINFNSMALQDMTIGGVLIDADFICKDDKIVIVPRIQNQFIENHTLRVTATGIEDLYGNAADQVVWEFYVNRSNLYWNGGDIDEVVIEGNELMVRREIRNQSGQRTNFSIENYPDWMQIFPTSGALDPGQILPVNFVFPADLVANAYATVVQMQTIDGEEPIKVDLRVACPSPDWTVDPSQYSFSMNLTLQLNIEGTLSIDKLDKVGAFVDGQLRGVGSVRYSRSVDKHLVFLTVYGNIPAGETVTFQIWDASACLLFASTTETFPFVADGLIGSPLEPQVVYTDNKVLRKIQIHPGWNWISYNINLTDPSTNNALSLLTNPGGGLIKSQTEFSTYSIGAGAWLGDLTDLSHLTMYQYNSLAYDSLILIGAPVDPTTQIPLVAGWNWIGYLPQYGLPVTEALQSLNPVNGDIIKSQISFAQYVAGVGWVGNLNFLSTPNGYLLKLANADTLVYPPISEESNFSEGDTAGKNRRPVGYAENRLTDIDVNVSAIEVTSHWSVIPQNFEFSMNAIAIVVNQNTSNLLKDGDEVAAFVGNEVRGVGKAIYVAALDSYMLFMTMYANKEGELVTFKYYNSQEAIEYPISNSRGFTINSVWGKIENPVELMIESAVATEDGDLMKGDHMLIYPNPSSNYIYINFTCNIDEDVEIIITDLVGTPLKKFNQKAQQGQNVVEWRPESGLPNGLYIVTLKTNKGSYNRFAELQR